jgi:hypothetical protein
MQPGTAVIKGEVWSCDTVQSTPIPAPSGLNRIDRLVLRLNRGASTSSTVISPAVIAGTPASNPVEPGLVQTPTGIFDIPISSWLSQSSGALISLVDERQFSSNPVLVGTSTQRPNPTEPCLLIETDVPDVILYTPSGGWQSFIPIQARTFQTIICPAAVNNIGSGWQTIMSAFLGVGTWRINGQILINPNSAGGTISIRANPSGALAYTGNRISACLFLSGGCDVCDYAGFGSTIAATNNIGTGLFTRIFQFQCWVQVTVAGTLNIQVSNPGGGTITVPSNDTQMEIWQTQ